MAPGRDSHLGIDTIRAGSVVLSYRTPPQGYLFLSKVSVKPGVTHLCSSLTLTLLATLGEVTWKNHIEIAPSQVVNTPSTENVNGAIRIPKAESRSERKVRKKIGTKEASARKSQRVSSRP